MGIEPFLPEPSAAAPEPLPAALPADLPPPGESHLVVVRTRAAGDSAAEIVTRYWHPRRRAWQEQTFESLEHAMHLFVEENGWTLRQQQRLDHTGAEELIFAVDLSELDQPSARELLLEEVGLTPEDAEALLDRVDEQADQPDR